MVSTKLESTSTTPEQDALSAARQGLAEIVDLTRTKVRETTGLEMRRSWVAPVVAGAAGLALALWLRRRRS